MTCLNKMVRAGLAPAVGSCEDCGRGPCRPDVVPTEDVVVTGVDLAKPDGDRSAVVVLDPKHSATDVLKDSFQKSLREAAWEQMRDKFVVPDGTYDDLSKSQRVRYEDGKPVAFSERHAVIGAIWGSYPDIPRTIRQNSDLRFTQAAPTGPTIEQQRSIDVAVYGCLHRNDPGNPLGVVAGLGHPAFDLDDMLPGAWKFKQEYSFTREELEMIQSSLEDGLACRMGSAGYSEGRFKRLIELIKSKLGVKNDV
jgi:hypothetical protein